MQTTVADIETTAGEWLVRRASGGWTELDQLQLEAWLSAAVAHRVAYLRLERAWEESARLKALDSGSGREAVPRRDEWSLSAFHDRAGDHQGDGESVRANARAPLDPTVDMARPRLTTRRIVTVTALACVAVTLAFLSAPTAGTLYQSAVGDRQDIALRDGSRITLNTASRVRVLLTAKERHVTLLQGEAFFEVAKDSSRPFVVEADDKRVVAVGTQFSVRREVAAIDVVVTEGHVRLEDNGEQLLDPGNVARADRHGIQVRCEAPEAANDILSWRHGTLTFRDELLPVAIAEFNRYNSRQIVIGDAELATLRVEGNVKTTNVDGFLRFLESGLGVHAHWQGDRIVLASR